MLLQFRDFCGRSSSPPQSLLVCIAVTVLAGGPESTLVLDGLEIKLAVRD